MPVTFEGRTYLRTAFGRSRLPEQLDPAAFGPAAVWKATVDQAIERGVDAVMLTGDIVDKDNKFYEASICNHSSC